MKRHIGLLLLVFLALGASASRGGWYLQIHKGGTVDEHAVEGMDSLAVDFVPPPGMVLVQPGTFIMGSPLSEPGREIRETPHEVTLTNAFYVSILEVTQSEWQEMMEWLDTWMPGPNRPVESVTWCDAINYCNQRSIHDGFNPVYTITGPIYEGNHIVDFVDVTWNQDAIGYRLLTEAEWEYACRATSTTAICNGDLTNIQCMPADATLDQVAWFCANSPSTTRDVGGKMGNAWGIKDMHGNVWEWCWDRWGDYPTGPVTDPTGADSSSFRVFRGGCFTSFAYECRSAFRAGGHLQFYFPWNGFRVGMTAP